MVLRLGRFVLAVVASAVVVAAAYGVWTFGLAQFDDDYCLAQVRIPPGDASIPAPEWEPPLTYRCDFGDAGVVTANEPRPILWTGFMAGSSLLAVAGIWWLLATRSSTAEYEGKHRA